MRAKGISEKEHAVKGWKWRKEKKNCQKKE